MYIFNSQRSHWSVNPENRSPTLSVWGVVVNLISLCVQLPVFSFYIYRKEDSKKNLHPTSLHNVDPSNFLSRLITTIASVFVGYHDIDRVLQQTWRVTRTLNRYSLYNNKADAYTYIISNNYFRLKNSYFEYMNFSISFILYQKFKSSISNLNMQTLHPLFSIITIFYILL